MTNNSVARRRGAPKGNHNALKHGLRSAALRSVRRHRRALIANVAVTLANTELAWRIHHAFVGLEWHREAYEVHKLIADTANALGGGTNFGDCRAMLKLAKRCPNS